MELKFLLEACDDLTVAIDFFEKAQAHVHNTRVKLEQILVTQLGKIVDDKYVNNLDADDKLMGFDIDGSAWNSILQGSSERTTSDLLSVERI